MRVCSATAFAICDGRVVNSVRQSSVTTRVGEPDAGNLHVRFDEGER